MRVAFAGGDAFAVPALRMLAAAGDISVCAVATNPPRPAGRGLRMQPSPVAQAAQDLGLEPAVPDSDDDLAAIVSGSQADFLVVCAYGRILRSASLAAAKQACVNIHASLLPRWRGAAPIERAIIAGDAETGVSTMLVVRKLDAGPVLLQRGIGLAADSTGGQVREQLAELGAELLIETLAQFSAIRPQDQDNSLATYAPKITKDETWLDLAQPAAELERVVRAFAPAPGARIDFAGSALKILAAEAVAGAGAPGALLAADGRAGLTVACQSKALRLLQVQPAGGRPMAAQDFVRGLRSIPQQISARSASPRSSAG